MYKKIDKCRLCGNTHLERVLDLGEQMLTGIFPKERGTKVTAGPLRLVKCVGGAEVCGLLQLEHSYDLNEMYGENYGYRSGLNDRMVAHLHDKIARIQKDIKIREGDLVVDIGSNDSTTLQSYTLCGQTLVGIDPTGTKFQRYYPSHVELIPEFFSASLLKDRFPGRKAKVITSFSMFYDLEEPLRFMQEIWDVLTDDGVWVFEQSYMPTMLAMNAYDTVCHEHLEYYALRQIKWMADRVGFDIVNIELNDVNGGSFSISVVKSKGNTRHSPLVKEMLEQEEKLGLNELAPYRMFATRVARQKERLLEFVDTARREGRSIGVLGASTKGNVVLQYCGLSPRDIMSVGEVNSDKYGCYTPGTWIPIVPEDELLALKPDYLLALPWHFRDFFKSNKKYSGLALVVPLPNVELL